MHALIKAHTHTHQSVRPYVPSPSSTPTVSQRFPCAASSRGVQPLWHSLSGPVRASSR